MAESDKPWQPLPVERVEQMRRFLDSRSAVSGERARHRRVAELVRQLGLACRSVDGLSAQVAERALPLAQALIDELATAPAAASPPAALDWQMALLDRLFEHGPLLGQANPVAPPLRVECEPDEVRVRVSFSTAFEGPPGCVHGGCLAAVLEESLGLVPKTMGLLALTAGFSIRYHLPTPVDSELVVSARVEKREGRKLFTWARGVADGATTTSAEALFIVPPG